MTGNLRWLANYGHDGLSGGVSFGMPWPKGLYQAGQSFVIEANSQEYAIDSREIAYWVDGSLKWTAHSVSGHVVYSEEYIVRGASKAKDKDAGVVIEEGDTGITVTTRLGLQVKFARSGSSSLFESLSLRGRALCSGATLVASVNHKEYSTIVSKVGVENATNSRAVIKVSGTTASPDTEHLPFDVRVYAYSDALPIKILHSFVHDLDADEPLTSLGIRFSVPVEASSRKKSKDCLDYDTAQQSPTELIQQQDELSLLSKRSAISDGFTIKKRTKKDCSWVKVMGGGRADGTVYLGSASHGGIAVGMSDFWERYPTQLDLTELTQGQGAITVWLYSPLAEPLDTSPYHDGLGQDSYEKQLQALDVTYEDYEPGFATANGLELFLRSREEPSPSSPNRRYIHSTGVFHGCWSSAHKQPAPQESAIEYNLDLLFSHYQRQIEQHRWYGFWDHGDVQHTYDPYRHAWRYDVGGFAWGNSELSTDLWLWLYFLHTGRADVFKMAETMTRHTSKVDVYHAGRFKGFGTRHGVQHFSDSSKQLRISNVLYKRIYFYLTGDERTGDLIPELHDCQFALLTLDSHRKVQAYADVPDGFAMTNIGLDCDALAAAWLTAWERRTGGWEHCRDLLVRLLDGIACLKHGIGNNAILLNPTTGEIRECPPPTPEYAISHLSMLFGFPETVAELLDYARDTHPAAVDRFMAVWLAYCKAYNGGSEVQRREFGFGLPDHATWRQSHSTLTAYAAVQLKSEELARTAWDQFFHTDGYTEGHDWRAVETAPPEYFTQGEEAAWITTNEAARYGVSAIFNLANIREYLP
ncbi:hypothetical protein CNMCM5793_003313 [Aspergillus hiratsukae]|uniref:Tat pathway signal sequence domain protein n=1 Tax=Aspergillus hiratsukae TaxID=1194566 RepID=A0A8H6UI86_9EURO|nr:hypothetical protein CNMCM5793_003313 [Aspergillus hiratsukae]KAF7169828.1 hypothetical protein CNMCM6106_004731 [Aspergillus hiratsukae]